MEPADDILDTSKFTFAGDFDEQFLEVLSHVRLTRTEVENLQHLLDDVEESLSYVWPGCRVHPFGSIVTGLGIKTSDIDCFVDIPPDRYRPSAKEKQKGPQVIIARNCLRKDRRFTNLFAITAAKVPIVKFVHLPTGFNCDVNFTSFSGVKNSKLIAFMLNLDRRALPLTILIKYWSKVYNFTGTNLMPNYALTMMVIFYLQVRSILPPVVELQRDVECDMVDNWNTAFDRTITSRTKNQQDLYDLLGGFLKYYKEFDYEHLVISPFLGYPIRKELLADINIIPSEFHLYQTNVFNGVCKVIRMDSAVCVQDPFEHGRNCSIGVFGKLFQKVLKYFEVSAKMFSETDRDVFLASLLTMAPLAGMEIPRPNTQQAKFKTNNKVMKHKPYNHQWNVNQVNRNKVNKNYRHPHRPPASLKQRFNRWLNENKFNKGAS